MNTDPADLREFRQSRNLSQPQIAELLNTPVGTWKNWEQGRTVPPGCLGLALDCVDERIYRQCIVERVSEMAA